MRYILVAEDFWGDMTEEQAEKDYRTRIFHCGHCSNSDARVYHNIIGRHRHCHADLLLEFMPKVPEMLLPMPERLQ